MKNLYEQIGAQKVREVIEGFYSRAFKDPMIGYFFRDSDFASLVEQQTKFASALLGGPKEYAGESLQKAHKHLNIRSGHFGRRQVIMAEVLAETDLAPEVQKAWLEAEEKLRPLIIDPKNCRD